MGQPDGVTDSHRDRGGSRPSGLGPRRVVWLAFGASVAIHVLLVLIYPSLVRRIRPDAAIFQFPGVATDPQGVDVIRLVEIDETPDVERPEDPDEIEEVEEPTAEVTTPTIGGLPGIDLPPPRPGLTAAERLRPNLRDARLWAPFDPAYFELTLEQREELIVAGRLTAWYDSVATALAAEAALTDWTFTDSDGGRWGISPGQIHLGDITLPLPFEFGTAVGLRDEVNLRVWQWEEIARQGARAEVQETWRERAEAIRARRDRDRAAVQPDTIRGRE